MFRVTRVPAAKLLLQQPLLSFARDGNHACLLVYKFAPQDFQYSLSLSRERSDECTPRRLQVQHEPQARIRYETRLGKVVQRTIYIISITHL